MISLLPPQLDVEPFLEHQWSDKDQYSTLAGPLLNNGFSQGGIYRVPQVPALRAMVYFIVPEGAGYAIINDHKSVGVYLQIVYRYQDGSSDTFVARNGTGMDQMPGHPNLYFGDISGGELLKQAMEQRSDKPQVIFHNGSELIAAFQKHWADYREWRSGHSASKKEREETYDRWRKRWNKEIDF